MNICLISQEYPPETGGGGIGTQTYLKAQGLAARGHNVHVVSASWDRKNRVYRDGTVTVHRIAEPRVNAPGWEPSTYWLAYSSAVAGKLSRLAREVSFDIMQFPEYGGEGFIYQTDTFQKSAAKYVVQMHGPLGMFADHMGWPEIGSTLHQVGCFMERTVIHHAHKLLASSFNTAVFCAEKYDCALGDIEVIHSAVDLERFRPMPSPESDRVPRILFVGNMTSDKGVTLLIDALLEMRNSWPKVELAMIGKGDKEFLEQLRRKIGKCGAEQNFRFVGYVPHSELPEWYAWCDFFAGPSRFEPGPGNIYLEAMACARPVIACRSGGAPEVVLDRETGLLVAPEDACELRAAMEELASDSQLRSRLGGRGRQWVSAKFSMKHYIDRVEGIYLKALEQRI